MTSKSFKIKLNRFFTVISLFALTFITSSCFTFTEITKEDLSSREPKDEVKITTFDGKEVQYYLMDLTVKDSVLIVNKKWHKDTIQVSNIKSIQDVKFSKWVYSAWGLLGLLGAVFVVLLIIFLQSFHGFA